MGNETAQVRILACLFYFIFFRLLFVHVVCVCVESDEGLVHFLHIVAKSPSAFP